MSAAVTPAPASSSVARADFLDGRPLPIPHPEAEQNAIVGQQAPTAATIHAMPFRHTEYTINGRPVEETFDAIIVGAGISGLAAAWNYRKSFGSDKRILLIEALNDFGGHARRNEWQVDGELLIGYGGSETLHAPKTNYSAVVLDLLKELGVDYTLFESRYYQHNLFPSFRLSRGSFFDGRASGGKDVLVSGDPTPWVSDDLPHGQNFGRSIEEFVNAFPISAAAKADLLRLYTDKSSVTLSRLSSVEAKVEHLEKMSYRQFLKDEWKVSDEATEYFNQRGLDFFGLSTKWLPAIDAFYFGYPGFLGLSDIPQNEEYAGEMEERYVHHFPDGVASLARLLVRALIPGIAPGSTMEDIVTARFDRSKLDVASNAVRIRLDSAVVYIKQGEGDDKLVHVGYTRNGGGAPSGGAPEVYHITARHVIYAGFLMGAPYIVQGLPAPQKSAMSLNVKVPMIYTNVVIRNWQSFVSAGVCDVYAVSSFHSRIRIDFPVTMGDYKARSDPNKPCVLHLVHVPKSADDAAPDARTALRMTRKSFFSLQFAELEKHVREDLQRLLGPYGFDEKKDIIAITVNRWSHGYSWARNSLADGPDSVSEAKISLGRQPFGSITFAGSDASWSPYAHAAIDEAHRAVQELAKGAAK